MKKKRIRCLIERILVAHFQNHSAESWYHQLFVHSKHIHTYNWHCISVMKKDMYASCLCMCFPPYRDFIYVCLVVWFLISGQFFATGCYICVCACVCKHVQWICCSQCEFFTSLGTGVLCERWKEKALFWRTYRSAAFSPGIFSSHDLISFFFLMYYVFHVLSAFYDIKCLCQWGGRRTLQHWKLFLWGFDLRSAPLYFARPPSATFTFVSPLLVRPRY